MDHCYIQLPTVVPDLSRHQARERLENEITELAAHINAAHYDLLVLIGRHDEDKGWVEHALASCAHWLQWRCGTNLGVAREKVRVARALRGLPQISAAFREGRFTPEQGVLIQKALEKAMDEQFEERQDEHPDVAAATRNGSGQRPSTLEWQRSARSGHAWIGLLQLGN